MQSNLSDSSVVHQTSFGDEHSVKHVSDYIQEKLGECGLCLEELCNTNILDQPLSQMRGYKPDSVAYLHAKDVFQKHFSRSARLARFVFDFAHAYRILNKQDGSVEDSVEQSLDYLIHHLHVNQHDLYPEFAQPKKRNPRAYMRFRMNKPAFFEARFKQYATKSLKPLFELLHTTRELHGAENMLITQLETASNGNMTYLTKPRVHEYLRTYLSNNVITHHEIDQLSDVIDHYAQQKIAFNNPLRKTFPLAIKFLKPFDLQHLETALEGSPLLKPFEQALRAYARSGEHLQNYVLNKGKGTASFEFGFNDEGIALFRIMLLSQADTHNLFENVMRSLLSGGHGNLRYIQESTASFLERFPEEPFLRDTYLADKYPLSLVIDENSFALNATLPLLRPGIVRYAFKSQNEEHIFLRQLDALKRVLRCAPQPLESFEKLPL
ncbi:hypothetical protein COT72_01220 [archaeon CG10_big_fil_rev_8_21_14_0_10_43_11]|nr:MAG: hypothetical protein COT72_01220 [archaeon CG10_big_fil_rev_8_21_14_0_10_43_11]